MMCALAGWQRCEPRLALGLALRWRLRRLRALAPVEPAPLAPASLPHLIADVGPLVPKVIWPRGTKWRPISVGDAWWWPHPRWRCPPRLLEFHDRRLACAQLLRCHLLQYRLESSQRHRHRLPRRVEAVVAQLWRRQRRRWRWRRRRRRWRRRRRRWQQRVLIILVVARGEGERITPAVRCPIPTRRLPVVRARLQDFRVVMVASLARDIRLDARAIIGARAAALDTAPFVSERGVEVIAERYASCLTISTHSRIPRRERVARLAFHAVLHTPKPRHMA